MVANASCDRTLRREYARVSVEKRGLLIITYLICEVVKETLVRSTADPCYEDLDSFAGGVDPGHHNPYRAASHGRVVRLWGNHENAGGNHAVCLLVRPFASTRLVEVEDFFSVVLSMTLVVEKTYETFRRVLGCTCPQLEQYTNRLEAAAPARRTLCVRCRGVLDGGKGIVCRRCVSRNRVSGVRVSQTCER
jgi:hypothetical protein